MITLENRRPKLVHFPIPIAIGGGREHFVGRTVRSQDSDKKRGAAALVVSKLALPTTLYLTAKGTKGSTSEPLPDEVQNAPEIAKAIASKELVLVQLADAPPEHARSWSSTRDPGFRSNTPEPEAPEGPPSTPPADAVNPIEPPAHGALNKE